MTAQPRQPAGVPVGGQFAVPARTEPGTVTLGAGDGDPDVLHIQHDSGLAAKVYTGEDNAIVVQVDTPGLQPGLAVRVHLNDGTLYKGDPEVDESAPARMQALETYLRDTLVPFLADDKSNDWSEEIAELSRLTGLTFDDDLGF